ncbi:MAG: ComF family protein [Patescibacteria group bacterium]
MEFKKIKNFILDLFFPKECFGCGEEGLYLCHQCLGKIDLNKRYYCALCKAESRQSLICPNCRTGSSLLAVWVATDYNNKILQDLIHHLKYNYLEELAEDLANLAISYLETNNILNTFELNQANTIIVPVPLHKKRFLSRGFNQSELLTKKIGNYFRFSNKGLITRNINTPSQINLKRIDRQANVRDVFSLITIKDCDKNKKIILIDDVITTGSTLNECAKILSEHGFKEIYGLVIAQRED